jgi:hypothetical protein
LKVAVLPDITKGINAAESRKEIEMKAKDKKFLMRFEIQPINGRMNEPIIGTKTMLRSTAL